MPLGDFGGSIASLDGLLNGPYPLIGEVEQGNVGGHDRFLLSDPLQLTRVILLSGSHRVLPCSMRPVEHKNTPSLRSGRDTPKDTPALRLAEL
jgi:hypothetical protein